MKRSTPLTRRTGLARGKPLARSGRMKASNRSRKRKAYARNFGDEADAVRAMPCIITGKQAEPAHVTSRGASGGRFDIVPLAPELHREQHAIGIKSFEAKYGLDLRLEADRIALEHAAPLGLRAAAVDYAVVGFAAQTVNGNRYDLDALLGWVRRRMSRSESAAAARSLGSPHVRGAMLLDVANDLSLSIADGEALCEAAGWPP